MSSKSRLLVAQALVCSFAIVVPFSRPSLAGLFQLEDENSSAAFSTDSVLNHYNWLVDGEHQLSRQAFWYRVGNMAEQSVHLLPIGFETASNTNLDPDLDTLFVRYSGTGFTIDVRYSLDGGLPGSRASDVAEQISISNTGASPLDFHFFQYADFDLNDTPHDDSAVFTNANTVRQTEGALAISETVITPAADHREIALAPVTLNSLNDGAPTTLSDTPPIGIVEGPGNMAWAFQWDFTLAPSGSPGSTFQISKDKHLSGIPEPAAAVLLCMGFGLLIGAWRAR